MKGIGVPLSPDAQGMDQQKGRRTFARPPIFGSYENLVFLVLWYWCVKIPDDGATAI